MLFRAFASSGREALLLSEMRVPRCSGYLGHPSAPSHFSFPIVQIHRVVFPLSYSLSAQLPRNNQLCSAVRLRPLLQRSTPENGQVLDADTGSLVQREFIQCLVSMAALVQPSKDGLAEQMRSLLMNHLLPLALTNEDQVHAAPPLAPLRGVGQLPHSCPCTQRQAMTLARRTRLVILARVCCPTLGSHRITNARIHGKCAASPLHLLLQGSCGTTVRQSSVQECLDGASALTFVHRWRGPHVSHVHSRCIGSGSAQAIARRRHRDGSHKCCRTPAHNSSGTLLLESGVSLCSTASRWCF